MERKKLKKSKERQAALDALRKANQLRAAGGTPNNYGYRQLLQPNPEVDPAEVPPHNSKGRQPSIADPVVREKILEKIREGNFLTTAASYAGITPHTLKRVLGEGREGKDRLYYEFWREVQQAEAEAEVNRLEQIQRHAETDWRAGLEILSRRWPERWAKREHHRHEVSGEVEHRVRDEFAGKILADPVSRDLARQLLSRNNGEEGEEVMDAEYEEVQGGNDNE